MIEDLSNKDNSQSNWSEIYERDVFPFVERPARYINNEVNSIHPDGKDIKLRVALVFPDAYEVGISHLGLKILYSILNEIPGVSAERCYAPWVDAEKILRDKNIPLCSLESCRPLKDFDIIGFSVQYELCYTNLLNILDLSGIPLRSAQRNPGDNPLILAGGNIYNPGVLEPFIDVFALGDGEELIVNIANWFLANKASFAKINFTDQKLAELVSQVAGLYAPQLYDFNQGQMLTAQKAKLANVPYPVEKQILAKLDVSVAAKAPLIPYCEAVHDRGQVEIMRGCLRGCRFCQAGMVTRPLRQKTAANVVEEAKQIVDSTGFEDISLTSLSSGDHTEIKEVLQELLSPEIIKKRRVAVSLPSLRIDSFDSELAELIGRVRRTGFTFAPEAGSERLRKVINKGLSQEEILTTIKTVFESGWDLIKVYFMIGLPTETMQDIAEMADLIVAMTKTMRQTNNGRARINISISTFVPKSFTPFQWAKFSGRDEIEEKQNYILDQKPRQVNIRFHDWRQSSLEAVFARGDQRLAAVVEQAFNDGARFDDWGEHFNVKRWHQAFEKNGIDMNDYFEEISIDQPLPWNVLDYGITPEFLKKEWLKAKAVEETPYCREGNCANCGINRKHDCQFI